MVSWGVRAPLAWVFLVAIGAEFIGELAFTNIALEHVPAMLFIPVAQLVNEFTG
jgi:hypothetical protein